MEKTYDVRSNAQRSGRAEWEHPNGRNEKHWRRDDRQIAKWKKEIEIIDVKIATIKANPYDNCHKDKLDLERQRRGWQRRIDERGVEHSITAKSS